MADCGNNLTCQIDIGDETYIAVTAYKVCTQEHVDYTDPDDPNYVNPCSAVGDLIESDYSSEVLYAYTPPPYVAPASGGSITYELIVQPPTHNDRLQQGRDYKMSIGPDGSIIFTLPEVEEGDTLEMK
jgi:hypothetical protein